MRLWFAFKLVSLNHWKQLQISRVDKVAVVICFQISIFEPLETTKLPMMVAETKLWFAFKLVSLNHWKQPLLDRSIRVMQLWFAFKLVSLNHWKQRIFYYDHNPGVVICFQISIFEPLETTISYKIWQTESCDLLSN